MNPEGRKTGTDHSPSEYTGADFRRQLPTDRPGRWYTISRFACVSCLKIFHKGIEALFPKFDVDLRGLQIRNALKYVESKNQQEGMAGLKPIHKAGNTTGSSGKAWHSAMKAGRQRVNCDLILAKEQ